MLHSRSFATIEEALGILLVKGNGKKEITSVKIDATTLDKEDIEMLEDIILVAVNDINKQVDKVTEQKMGKFTQGMPGLF